MHPILFLIVSILYGAVAFDYWRQAEGKDNPLNLHATMLVLGMSLHAWLLYHSIFNQGLNFGVFNAISAILWLTVVIYWVVDMKQNFHSLQAVVLPPAAVFALLPGFLPQSHYLPEATQLPIVSETLFRLHIGIAMLAYSLFTFAALHTFLMALAERSLHQKLNMVKAASFPPLMVMETLLFRIISIGFALLTLTLLSGVFFSEALFGKPMQFNHKTIFSIASWLIYAGLLWGRYQYGWRGRKAILWTRTGFVLLLLAYIGSKFVLEIILHR